VTAPVAETVLSRSSSQRVSPNDAIVLAPFVSVIDVGCSTASTAVAAVIPFAYCVEVNASALS